MSAVLAVVVRSSCSERRSFASDSRRAVTSWVTPTSPMRRARAHRTAVARWSRRIESSPSLALSRNSVCSFARV